MLKLISKYILAAIVGALISGVGLFSLTGCNSFEVIRIKGQPDECNDFYTIMQFYSAIEKGTDSAFIGTVYTECKTARAEARKALKEKHCKDMIFGVDAVMDKSDYKKYNHFLECTK